jgi:hypothetical protein
MGLGGLWTVVRVVTDSDRVRASVPATSSRKVDALQRRVKRRGEDAGRGRGAGWRRQPADDKLLDFLLRFEAVTESQAAKWFYGGSMTRAKRRIGFMTHSGLVQKYRDFPAVGTVIIPTRHTAAAAYGRDSILNHVNAPAHSRLTHLLFVSEVAAATMYDPVNPRQVISEREIRVFQDRGDEQIIAMLRDRGVTIADKPGNKGVTPVNAMVRRTRGGESFDVRQNFWITVRTGGVHATFRIPDFIEIRDGEMWAVEVEIAEKDGYRIREILAGYRDCTTRHNPVASPSDPRTLGELGRPIHSQFRGVRWVCAEGIAERLTGPFITAASDITDTGDDDGKVVIPAGSRVYGVNPATEAAEPGYVEQVWAKSATGCRMFTALQDKALTNPKRPVTVEVLDPTDQPGLEYLLAQATLPPPYRADYTEWGKWRTLWQDDVGTDPDPVGFTRWLRHDDNYRRCISTTRRQLGRAQRR